MNSATFLGREITKQQVISALSHFDSQYPDTNSYDSWLNKRTYKYAIQYSARLYPCKLILSLASHRPMSDFSGGQQTNNLFQKLKFKVINKP